METSMDKIGSRVSASSDFHDITGEIIGGTSTETGDDTQAPGAEIDLDGVVRIKADDDGKVYRVNGWLWSFESLAA